MKSRLVVWTLVGIIVIVGVVVVVSSPKQTRAPKLTLDLVKSEAAKVEIQVDRLAARIADARRALAQAAAPTNGLDDADRLLAEARDKLNQARTAPNVKLAGTSLVDGRQALRRARRAFDVATKVLTKPRGI